MPARRRERSAGWLILLMAVSWGCAASTCETCASNRWLDAPPFETSWTLFNENSLGLEAGSTAPLVSSLGIEGQRAILFICEGMGPEEVAALGIVADAIGVRVVAAFAACLPSVMEGIRDLVGENVDLVADPLASVAEASYLINEFTGLSGLTFLIDENGVIVLRRHGSPLWLMHDDFAVVRAFVAGVDVTQVAMPEHVLTEGETAPIPPLSILDQNDLPIDFDDDTPRLIFSGASRSSQKGILILNDLETLSAEFPEVEFVCKLSYKRDEQLADMWRLFNTAGIAHLHPEWYELSLDAYMDKVVAVRVETLARQMAEILPFENPEWRLVLDPDSQLGVFWGLRISPAVMILDGDRTVMLPMTTYPTDKSTGEWRVHPGALDALRAVLSDVTR